MATISITCPTTDDSVNLTFDVTGTFSLSGNQWIRVFLAQSIGPPVLVMVQTGTPWRVTLTATALSTMDYLGASLLDGPNGNELASDGPYRISVVSSGGRQC